ncbi:LuxR C-terminal-related transcriptional regulator [Flavobacterium cerinum]|uniref:LuxR C-terminal-related transcriptional regulator n=1 Tax=Flavobacterium cerinum TaxID=2502784 RepID=A0ABY5ITI1_9FLAO|nr:LuxR C-terminal-related transcriptional regulator [Flavobacterium cerinum]UUC44781.1 LuxR C-terminal-related transcriptional regulator [Flavobacterium cerinum]
MELLQFNTMKKTWHQIARYHDGNTPPSFELEVYKKLLNFFHIGAFYYYIVNLPHVTIEFVSDSVKTVLGIGTTSDFNVEYILSNIHPDDLNRFMAYEQQVTAFFNALPPDKVLKYKVSYDYRLRCADRSYKWILMQTVTIQSDEKGSVIRVLGIQTDITHLKSDNKPSGLSFIGLDGEPSYYNVGELNTKSSASKTLFTCRERQILQLIVTGKSTNEIADLLNISRHTVNTHRKNILSKSDCKSLVELGSKAIREGWI